jgi:hypothetical protein
MQRGVQPVNASCNYLDTLLRARCSARLCPRFYGTAAAQRPTLIGSERDRRGGSHRICGLLPHEVSADERSDFVLGRPELNTEAEKSIDFYGPCDYDPTGAAEVRAQRAILLRELHGDGSSD